MKLTPNLVTWLSLFFVVILFASLNSESVSGATPQSYVTVSGTLQATIIDNFDTGKFITDYYLITDKGVKIDLTDDIAFASYSPGDRLTVNGYITKNSLSSTTVTSYSSTSAIPKATGMKRTLVIMVNFPNETSQPVSYKNLSRLLGIFRHFAIESSYKQLDMSFDYYGWRTLNFNPRNGCSIEINHVLNNLTGVDTKAYDYRLIIYPAPVNCTSFAYYDAYYSTIAIQGQNFINRWDDFTLHVFAHEFGHAFGYLAHANFLNCSTEIDSDPNCGYEEYGDPFDPLGKWRYLQHYSAYIKNVFGWMNGTRIKDVHMPGIYALGAYEITDSNSRALRISRKFGTNDLDYLYLEYRKPIGFDTSIGAKPVVNSILVHINQILPLKLPLSSRMQFSSGLIDTTPTVPESRLDPALKYGKKFRDKNLEVAFIYKDDRRAYIAVQYFCEDGTALGQCSTSKPNYCDYSTGSANHINKCSACGCPSGYACRADESCSRIIFQSAET